MAQALNSRLYDRGDVRNELRKLLYAIHEAKRRHLCAFGLEHRRPADAEDRRGSIKACGQCHVCDGYDEQAHGVRLAIRHFGGRPR